MDFRTRLPLLLLLMAWQLPSGALGDPPLPRDGGVVISSVAAVRLAGGKNALEGRVEVQLGGRWGSLCGAGFTAADARVVCTMLGNPGGKPKSFGKSKLANLVSGLKCTGSETQLAACKFQMTAQCAGRVAAGVVCQRPAIVAVRLADGDETSPPIYAQPAGSGSRGLLSYSPSYVPPPYVPPPSSPSPCNPPYCNNNGASGRLEVQLSSGKWGTVCDKGFDDADAQVVCRMLGLVGGKAFRAAAYGPGKIPVRLERVNCKGSEANLTQCGYSTQSACTHASDVSVVCQAPPSVPVRLAGGKNGYEGRLEVQIGGKWGTVCSEQFTNAAATVACRKLSFPGGRVILNPNVNFGTTKLPVLINKVRCTGKETELSACTFKPNPGPKCTHARDIKIACTRPPITSAYIYNGSSTGYLQVSLPSSGGSICADGFANPAAKVACKMVGFPGGAALPSPPDPSDIASQTKVVGNLVCKGTELSLAQCNYVATPAGVPCKSKRSAKAKCTEWPIQGLRIQGNKLSGTLEAKVRDRWGPVCSLDFGEEEAKVACRQLGKKGGEVVDFSGTFQSVVLAGLTCKGTEASLGQCEYHTQQDSNETDEFPCWMGMPGYMGSDAGPVAIKCTA